MWKITKSIFRILLILATFGVLRGVISSEKCEEMKLSAGHSLEIQKALPGAWPWMVAIFSASSKEYKFSGSLISKEHVLIAAHRVYGKGQKSVTSPKELSIWFGKYDLNIYEPGSLELNASDVIVYPGWDPEKGKWNTDVALLLLDFAVEFNEKISAVELPKVVGKIDENGFLIGWNLNHKDTNVKELSNLKQSTLLQVLDCPCEEKFKIGSTMNRSHIRSTGDGFVVTESDWTLGGILLSTSDINAPKPCEKVNSIFLRITPYLHWIKETVNFTTTEFVTLKCTFKTSTFLGNNLDYLAKAEDWQIRTQRVKVASIEGSHESSKGDNSVEELDIKEMRLMKYLPMGLGKIFKKLKNLSANFNGLILVTPEVFMDMPNLKLLWLQDNEIEALLEDNFKPLVNLEYLRLSRNRIKTLPSSPFLSLKHLKKLRLNGNLIEDLPENLFKGLNNLQYLDVSSNKIATLPASISQNLKGLNILLAPFNQITIIHTLFMSMTNLTQVNLERNICIDDIFGYGGFNWILFGSKRYLRNLQDEINESCKGAATTTEEMETTTDEVTTVESSTEMKEMKINETTTVKEGKVNETMTTTTTTTTMKATTNETKH